MCRMVPAPMKPMPGRIWAATRAGSPRVAAMWRESTVKNVAPVQMRMLVRRPAGLPLSSRSRPIAPPNTTASRSWNSSSNRRSRTRLKPMSCTRSLRRRVPAVLLLPGPGQGGPDEVPVHAGDRGHADPFRADRLALPVVRAGSEAGLVHGGHHLAHALQALGLALGKEPQVGDLGRGEERRGGVGAGGHAGPTAD